MVDSYFGGVDMNRKRRFLRGSLTAIILFIFIFMTAGCDTNPGNKPYEPDTPAPEAHKGTFVSDNGSLTFEGDGKKITIEFDEELAGLTGLPAGKNEGTYAFLSGELPPNGSVEVRYDVAHELRIVVGDKSVVLNVGITGDGSTYQTGTNVVTADKIPLVIKVDGKYKNFVFEKK